MHSFNDDMRRCDFSANIVSERIYILMERRMYRIKYKDNKAVWERVADLVSDHGDEPLAVTYSGSIYAAGSGMSLWITEAASKYDIARNRWEKVRDKKLATRDAVVVALKGHVYCIGGYDDDIGTTARVERLNTSTLLWDGS